MHKSAMEMGKWALEKAKNHGYDNLTSQDWDDLKDCLEIVKNAICADKDYREVEMMDEEEEIYGRMGYRGRDSKGRFVHRPGRGRSAGYTPYVHMMPPFMDGMYDEYDGMMPEDYRMGYSDGRGGRSGNYGGSEHSENAGNRGGSRYGESYDDYRKARRHYTETHSAEHQKEMRDKISEVFDDMETITADMVKDMSVEDKQKYKVKLQQMMQKIQKEKKGLLFLQQALFIIKGV